MFKEMLRVKAKEGTLEELKACIIKLTEMAEAMPECKYSTPYVEESQPGWILIDQEFETKEDFLRLLQDPELVEVDKQMKAMMETGESIVLAPIK